MKVCICCGVQVRYGPRCRSCGYKLASLKGKGDHRRGCRIFTETHRHSLSLAGKGKIRGPCKKRRTPEQRERYRIATTISNQSLEKRTKIAKATTENWKNPESELRCKVKAYWANEQNRARRSAMSKANWQTEEYRNKVVSLACRGASKNGPNAPETKLLSLLEKHHPHEWKYVGNGDIVIGGKCPDFANIDSQKKVILLHGSYWHKGEDISIIINHYAKYGYDCLIVWEHELKDENSIIERVSNL